MNTNRNKGHRWELKVLETLKPIFPQALTSRNESRTEDANKVDICYTGDLAIQAKNYGITPNFKQILSEMKTDKLKVIAWKNNRIRGKEGEFAVIQWEDFIKLLKK